MVTLVPFLPISFDYTTFVDSILSKLLNSINSSLSVTDENGGASAYLATSTSVYSIRSSVIDLLLVFLSSLRFSPGSLAYRFVGVLKVLRLS